MLVQLASRQIIDDVFSLCFGSVEGDGALLLGDVNLSQYNVELEYTPLLTSLAYPHYYSVQLLGLQVGGTKLGVPQVNPPPFPLPTLFFGALEFKSQLHSI